MIFKTTLAAIIAVVSPPTTQELGWVCHGTPISAMGQRELTEGHILEPGEAERETDGAFIPASNVSISRLDWIEAQIDAYSNLEEGWDGPDSQPPRAEHIRAARSILRSLPAGTPIPKPMLSSSGALGLYWEESEWMADIAIEGDSEFSLFFRSRDRSKELLRSGLAVGPDSSVIIKETLPAD